MPTIQPGAPRSSGSLAKQRIKQPWPKDRDFRILSIDGGGIRGIFPAATLVQLERRLGAERKIIDHFDLIAGTSTGGIIALGLGAGLPASDLLKLYTDRGNEVFPPTPFKGCLKRLVRQLGDLWQLARYRYDSVALEKLLKDTLKEKLIGHSNSRLCIPSFEGKHSEVFVYKTPHHPDYEIDLYTPMVEAALATSAAPGFFRPRENNGYIMVDGGVWANNPIMVAVIEALTAFDIQPSQIKVLSLGCGDEPYIVTKWHMRLGGFFLWRKVIDAAIRLQSMNTTNQVRLLISPTNVTRLDPPSFNPKIALDDWERSKELLPDAAAEVFKKYAEKIEADFLHAPVEKYVPFKTP